MCSTRIGSSFSQSLSRLRVWHQHWRRFWDELKANFGFFRLQRTCETILRFYSYDGSTNYVRFRTGGLQGDYPEFMIFCLVTLHLWGRIFWKFPEIKGLSYADDGNIIVKLSTVLKLISMQASVFKNDANLINICKTKVLSKGPSADHLFGIEVLVTLEGTFHSVLCRPKLSQNHGRYRETCLSHRWFRSCSTIEILPKYAHTIHQRKHKHPRLG